MRAKYVALFFIISAFACGMPVHAAIVDSQLDDSAQAIRPPIPRSVFIAAGYLPPRDMSIYGVRFRVNRSGSGDYICPAGGSPIIQYYSTSTPPYNWEDGPIIGTLVSATTTPDAQGNCDYTTIDNYGATPVSFYARYYYGFLMNVEGSYPFRGWVSLSGKPFASTTPVSLFGYRDLFSNLYEWGTTGLDVPYFEFFDTAPPPVVPPDPCATPGACASNVLFLPGIEGSRLYEGTGCGKSAEEKLWEPIGDSLWKILRGAGDDKVKNLFLDATGESACNDIYAKEDDIIDSAGGNIYKSFIDEMNGLKSDGTINDWKPVAYDWRLSLDDLLNKGAAQDGKIYYEQATDTPYILQTLRGLAASSKTGKVTIVAHSNGGLLSKAITNQLGSEASNLVDKIIMVGSPQSGAPEDLGATLVGYSAGIYKLGFPIVSDATARSLALNSPMAYHLLPSQNYLDSVASDTNHPVIKFTGDGYAKEESAYGSIITSSTNLDNFLLAKDGGRVQPDPSDTSSANILNSSLIDYANATHSTLDNWTPPAGVEVDQIAGWGTDTVAGIDFYTGQTADVVSAFHPQREYRPIFTEDGDGTVTIPSALMMASSTNVKRYWLNLFKFNREQSADRKHPDLFEIPSLQDFIKNILENSTSTLPTYISTNQPSPITDSKELTFFLHSPLTLQLTDSSGNVTGLASDDSMTEDIPGSTYGEFGDVKYITVPEGGSYQLTMHGQASGTFSLDIQETTGGDITASSTIANVPTTGNTLASLNISGGIDTASALAVDENGDGGNIITLNPVLGGRVNYVPPAPTPSPSSGSTTATAPAPSSSGSISIPVIAPASMGSTSSPQATTQSVATSTPVVTAIANLIKPKNKIAIAPKKIQIQTKEGNQQIPQTSSVLTASQQPASKSIITMFYNGLYSFWTAIKKFF